MQNSFYALFKYSKEQMTIEPEVIRFQICLKYMHTYVTLIHNTNS